MLLNQKISSVLSYDEVSGKLYWKWSEDKSTYWNKRYAGKEAGCLAKDGYVVIGFEGKSYKAHILAWVLKTGIFPTQQIDHKDRVRSNNAWENLREALPGENTHNRTVQPNSLSNVKGVGFREDIQKWYSRITHKGKCYFLGYVETKEEAITRYNAKADDLYGSFATHAC